MLIRATSFAGVAAFLGAYSGYTYGDAPLNAALALTTLGIICLGIGAYLAGIPQGIYRRVITYDPPRPTPRRIFAIGMVVMLVASSIPAPVSATHDMERCDEFDQFLWGVSFGITNSHCDPQDIYDNAEDEINAMKEAAANRTETDMYASATTVQEDHDQQLITRNNYLEDSRSVAWGKGQDAAWSAYKNGANESEMKAAFNETVTDYYTRMEMEVAKRAETDMVRLAYIASIANNDTGISDEWLEVNGYNADTQSLTGSTDNVTWTLLNGTTMTLETAMFRESSAGSEFNYPLMGPMRSGSYDTANTPGAPSPTTDTYNMTVPSLDSEHPSKIIWEEDRMTAVVDSIESKDQMVRDNGALWVESVYADAQNGTVNATDHVSTTTIAQEWATDYNTTGYYAYAAAVFANSGWYVPDQNTTGTMTISTGQGTYEGQLFSQGAPPSGVWETNVTYDADYINGTQLFATSDGRTIELNSTFTITEMYNRDGARIQTTTPQTYDYQTTNTSEYTALQNSLSELRETINAMDTSGGGGSSSSNDTVLLIVGIAAIALLATQGRDGGGNGGR